MVIVATGGIVSLRPVLAALRAGKVVATANKETLVAGGHLVMPLAKALAAARAATDAADPMASPLAWVRPIDSEHSALWQSLAGEQMSSVAQAAADRIGWAIPGLERGSGWRRPPRRMPWRTRPGPWAPRSPSTPPRS